MQPNSLGQRGIPSRYVDHEAGERRGDPEVHERVDAQLQKHGPAELDVLGFEIVLALHVHLHEVHQVDDRRQQHVERKKRSGARVPGERDADHEHQESQLGVERLVPGESNLLHELDEILRGLVLPLKALLEQVVQQLKFRGGDGHPSCSDGGYLVQ